MAEEQKTVEVPKDAPAAEPTTTETKVEETPAATTEATAEAAVTTTAEASTSAEEATAPAAEEAAKEEVTPIEAGSLEHKGSNFPKNFMYSKKFFWFGLDPVDTKAISTFKADKVADVAHHVTAWAAETGRGLLFYGEKSDKSAPHGAIQLSEASDPVVEGTNKFHVTSKGHKHTFKAGSAAERDNWVNQLKLKIAEAKELAETIKDTETYKNTLASLKPAPAKKEEKAPAAEPAKDEAAAEETPKDATEPAAEEPKKEESKRRSASRKRASLFGLPFGKKEEKSVDVAAETEAPAESSTDAPVTEAAPETTSPEATAVTEAPAETKVEDTKDVKPTPTKRGSIFGNLSFHKKKAAAPEASAASPAEETPAPTTEAVAETAPVIPAVETSEPLSTDVSSPATAPAETVEVAAAATNGETKKEVKSEKRKSSLPFGLGKKDKPTSDEEGAADKPKSPSPFSKLRATISRKSKPEKPAEEAAAAADKAEDKPATEGEPSTTEAIKEEEAAKPTEPVVPTIEEPTVAADKPVAATPVVPPVA